MKPEWRPYAPLGLVLAILAAVAAAVIYILYREINLWVQISLGLIVVGLAFFALLDPNRVRVGLSGRQARYGSNALVLTLAFLGILIVVNYVVFQNSKRWDLTEDREFTLSKETIDILKNLPQPVTATAFFSSNVSSQRAQELLDQFRFNSDGKMTFQFIDPYQDAIAAEMAKITRDGTIVLSMGGNQEQVTSVTEQEMANALVRLMNPDQRKVYFLTGHGERSLQASGQEGLSQYVRLLEGKNYAVDSLNLLASPVIPEDAKVIVVAGPQKPLSSEEVELLRQFVDRGGALIVAQDPVIMTQFEDLPDPMADYLAETWGIILGNDFVIDQSSNRPTVAVGAKWGNHSIVTPLSGFAAIFPNARSVSAGEAPSGITLSVLVSTMNSAWGETDMEALKAQEQVAPDPGVDLVGSVPLAVAGENFQTGAKVVVFGDADFLVDGFFVQYANSDLAVNSVDWAAGKEDLISLTPKSSTARTILPPQKLTMNLLFLGVIVVLPGVPLILGIVVWVQRRRRL